MYCYLVKSRSATPAPRTGELISSLFRALPHKVPSLPGRCPIWLGAALVPQAQEAPSAVRAQKTHRRLEALRALVPSRPENGHKSRGMAQPRDPATAPRHGLARPSNPRVTPSSATPARGFCDSLPAHGRRLGEDGGRWGQKVLRTVKKESSLEEEARKKAPR